MIRALLRKLFHRQAPWHERHLIWLLFLGVGVAMALSLIIGLMQSVWFDEAYSIWLAKQPTDELLRLTSLDTHPPFYYILLKLWASIFGWSEVALRSLSVVAMGGALTIGVLFVKRLFGIRAAIVALAFAALTPFLLRYGFEIRMYALASLIGVAATYVLVRAVQEKETKKQRWFYVLYAVLVALGIYTLYYIALLWIVHVIWLVWLAKYRKEPVLRQRWWLAYVGSALLFLPWLPTFIKQLTNGALAPISQQMTVDNLVGIVSFTFLYQPTWQLNGLSSLIIIAVIGVLIYASARAFTKVEKKQKPYLVLLALYAFLPILLIALISLARPMYVERYLAHTLIGLMLFVAVVVTIGVKRPKKMWLIHGGLVAVLLFGVAQLITVGNYNFQRLHVPQIKQAAEGIDCTDGRTVFAADPYVAIELSYYLTKCNITFYSESKDLKGGYAPLANSELRISDPLVQLADKKEITYVFYDEAKLQLPGRFQLANQRAYGPIHIQEYK